MERVSDEIDFASNIALAETENHVKVMQARLKNVKLDPDFDGVHCVECGLKINAMRIKALKFLIIKDGVTLLAEHHTDRSSTSKGVVSVVKHGTDKCVGCQEDFTRAQSAKGRQYGM